MNPEEHKRYSFWKLERIGVGDVRRLILGVTSVGRHSTSNIRIADSSYVSRNHAEIEINDDQMVLIRDMNSSNGVFVNDILYRNSSTQLRDGDQIAFGVKIDENESNFNDPIYILKYAPFRQDLNPNLKAPLQSTEILKTKKPAQLPTATDSSNSKVVPNNEQQLKNDAPFVLPKISAVLGNVQSINPISSNVIDNNEPSTSHSTSILSNKNELHAPIVPNLKEESICNVSNNIKDIFGDPDDIIMDNLKDMNPYVYHKMHGLPLHLANRNSNVKRPLFHGDVISLCSDESDDDIAISDNINKDNLPSSALPIETTNEKFKKNENDKQVNNMSKDLNELNENVGDDEELMFSQAVIDEIRADLADNDDNSADENANNGGYNDIIKNEPLNSSDGGMAITTNRNIKKELLEAKCWIISDDEEDEELENKVNDWSSKLFSQSFSQRNLSQVYDTCHDSNEELSEPNERQTHENLLRDVNDIANMEHADDNENDSDDMFALDFYNQSLENADEIIGNIFLPIQERFIDNDNKAKDEPKPLAEESKTTVSQEQQQYKPKETAVNCRIILPTIKELPSTECKSKDKTKQQTESKSATGTEIHKSHKSELTHKKSTAPLASKSKAETEKVVDEVPCKSTSSTKLKDNKNVVEKERSILTSTSISHSSKPKSARHPEIIDAPNLPKHRGKKRGVSAAPIPTASSSTLNKKILHLREEFRQERQTNDLKRKWLEKPRQSKKVDKDKINERKERLKQLAEKETKTSKEPSKRKSSECDMEHAPTKKAKVKLTLNNRGAFLTNPTDTSSAANSYRTANTRKIPTEMTKAADIAKSSFKSNESGKATRSLSPNTFSQQLSKPDKLLLTKRKKSIEATASTSTTASEVDTVTTSCREATRAQRTTNKITFASMQKNFMESHLGQQKLEQIKKTHSCLTAAKNLNPEHKRQKKKVRFNDTPIIHYVERLCGGILRKVDQKDIMPRTSWHERRQLTRSCFPIIDNNEKIISLILEWSNHWLVNRNAQMDAATDVIYPLTNEFISFEHYMGILFPLMRLEFVCMLEREFHLTEKLKPFKVHLEYVTENKGRLMLCTKFASKSSNEATKFNLVILNFGNELKSTFAYVSNNRRGVGTCSKIVFETLKNNFLSVEYLATVKEISVRPVVNNVRVEFGAFNAVYQLEATPLFNKIIKPKELLKYKPPGKRKIKYKGCDKLDKHQQEVLLNTYSRMTDEAAPNITLIKGPPGTGKSCVIANLALQALYGDEVRTLDKKILICAQSNAAVDVIAEKLFRIRQIMRNPEIVFRLVRYGLFDRIHPNVQPISLQKIVERDQLKKLMARNKNIQVENKEGLKQQMLILEWQIADMQSRNIKGTVEEDELVEKQRQLQLIRNIVNQSMRPEDERSIHTWYLSNANIVCTTLSSCVMLSQYVDFFDICIIDEATQCTEPWNLLPLKFGINALVLVGDTQQLPATVLSKKACDLGFGNSLFTRIQRCLESGPKNSDADDGSVAQTSGIVYSLKTQYRMHPEICKWPNMYFYKNELLNSHKTSLAKTVIQPFSILNLEFKQNDYVGKGKISNQLEAEFVAKLLKALDGYIPNTYNSYGVITPYAEQRNILIAAIKTQGLTNVMVNTIDSFQGLEKDVVVISNTRTKGIGFLANYQRLNVALTRPKKCLILCGNFKNLESVPAWRSLLNNARERKLFHEISASSALDIYGSVIGKIKLNSIV